MVNNKSNNKLNNKKVKILKTEFTINKPPVNKQQTITIDVPLLKYNKPSQNNDIYKKFI